MQPCAAASAGARLASRTSAAIAAYSRSRLDTSVWSSPGMICLAEWGNGRDEKRMPRRVPEAVGEGSRICRRGGGQQILGWISMETDWKNELKNLGDCTPMVLQAGCGEKPGTGRMSKALADRQLDAAETPHSATESTAPKSDQIILFRTSSSMLHFNPPPPHNNSTQQWTGASATDQQQLLTPQTAVQMHHPAGFNSSRVGVTMPHHQHSNNSSNSPLSCETCQRPS